MRILTDNDIRNELIAGHDGRGRSFSPIFIVVHIQEGLGDLESYFGGAQLDSTMWNPRQGQVVRYLEDSDTPWTNGFFSNLNHNNPVIMGIVRRYNPGLNPIGINSNAFSLTVENEGFPNDTMNPDQYARLVGLIAYWCQKHKIPADRNHIIGHGEIGEHAYCPGPIVENNWSRIITDVQTLVNKTTVVVPTKTSTAPSVAQGKVVSPGMTGTAQNFNDTIMTNEQYFTANDDGRLLSMAWGNARYYFWDSKPHNGSDASVCSYQKTNLAAGSIEAAALLVGQAANIVVMPITRKSDKAAFRVAFTYNYVLVEDPTANPKCTVYKRD